MKLEYVLKLVIHVSNNEAKYEALIAGLMLRQVSGANVLAVFNDS